MPLTYQTEAEVKMAWLSLDCKPPHLPTVGVTELLLHVVLGMESKTSCMAARGSEFPGHRQPYSEFEADMG